MADGYEQEAVFGGGFNLKTLRQQARNQGHFRVRENRAARSRRG